MSIINYFDLNNIHPIPVLLIIENELYRDLINNFLQTQLFQCWLAGNLLQAEKIIEIIHPGLVLVDDEIEQANGAHVIASLVKAYPMLPCIGGSRTFSERCLKDFILAGARGYTWYTLSAAAQLKMFKDINDGKKVLPANEHSIDFRP